jgi:hypothetical protein
MAIPRERMTQALPLIIGSALIQSFGQMALIAIVTDEGRSTVGEALRRAFGALPRLVGLMLATAIVFVPLILLLSLLLGGVIAALGADASAARSAVPVMMLPVIYVALRLILAMPVLVVEGGGPFATIRRSWRLTEGAVLSILGVLMLGALAFAGVSLIVGLVGGAVTGVFAGLFGARDLMDFVLLVLTTTITAVLITYLTVAVTMLWRRLRAEHPLPVA